MTVIAEETAIALKGVCSTDVDLSTLRSRFPQGLAPDWLIVAMGEFRLAGASLSLTENDDESGIGAELKWLTPIQMVSEAFESEPGLSVMAMGLLPIAACAIGSGDPYFLDLRTITDDPPLVRVLHDFVGVEGKSFPPEGIEVVSQHLSDFFAKATVN
ncbi:hypothetical protein [Duganella sp. Root1480D1]|uniref:hypothetical protein n=1 Tax=Duganella sp. Root1480D1 TaxID=1736471 RepID=UPI0012E3A451|nr:hypothetical protein [Duganella sp. Root1480D1]